MYSKGKLYEINEISVNNIEDYKKTFGKIEVNPKPVKDFSKFLKGVPVREKKTNENTNFKMI